MTIIEKLDNKDSGMWHPIETCPEDGFFLAFEDGAIRTMWRYKGEWRHPSQAIIINQWGDYIADNVPGVLPAGHRLAILDNCRNPTHWMALPEVPTEIEINDDTI